MRRRRWWKRFFWQISGIVLLFLLLNFFVDFDIHLRKKFDVDKDWKKELRQIKGKIYAEATKHNPGGDFWPDWVDDFLQGKLKEKWKEWFTGRKFDK